MGKHSLSKFEIKDDEDLVRAIAEARETAAFFHNFVDLIGEDENTRQQITANGWAGFAHILNALEEHLRDTTETAEKIRRKHRDEITELESAQSVKLGLPLEACRDPKFVSAWRSGYAHARTAAEKETNALQGLSDLVADLKRGDDFSDVSEADFSWFKHLLTKEHDTHRKEARAYEAVRAALAKELEAQEKATKKPALKVVETDDAPKPKKRATPRKPRTIKPKGGQNGAAHLRLAASRASEDAARQPSA